MTRTRYRIDGCLGRGLPAVDQLRVGGCLNDVDLDLDVLVVLGKGRRERSLSFGRKDGRRWTGTCAPASATKHADLPWLWLGQQGRLTDSARLPKLHPHQFRHTFANQWLAQGGNETDLIRLARWKSRILLQRYGASAAEPAPARPISVSSPPTGFEERP